MGLINNEKLICKVNIEFYESFQSFKMDEQYWKISRESTVANKGNRKPTNYHRKILFDSFYNGKIHPKWSKYLLPWLFQTTYIFNDINSTRFFKVLVAKLVWGHDTIDTLKNVHPHVPIKKSVAFFKKTVPNFFLSFYLEYFHPAKKMSFRMKLEIQKITEIICVIALDVMSIGYT